MQLRTRHRASGEEGVAVVEFALVLPVLVMLLLGMITSAIAWNQNLDLSQAGRTAARYGATLPVATEPTMDAWLDQVAARAVEASGGNLNPGTPGLQICTAYVHPTGTTASDRTRRRNQVGTAVTYSDATCFNDGQPGNSRRVQVVVGRNSVLDVGLWRRDLQLRRQTAFRFEAAAGL